MTGDKSDKLSGQQEMDVDDKDGFGPIRTSGTKDTPITQQDEDTYSPRLILDLCCRFLTVGPLLQSSSGEPTRDQDLTSLVLDCAAARPSKFFLIAPILLEQTRQRTFSFSNKQLEDILEEVLEFCTNYSYSRSESLYLLIVQLLDATLDVWLMTTHDATLNVRENAQKLCIALLQAVGNKTLRHWTSRDQFSRLLNKVLDREPTQALWLASVDAEDLPSAVLHLMGSDDDIRVRFRVAVINARLFNLARHLNQSPFDWYNAIKSFLATHIDKQVPTITEFIVTIDLSLQA